MIKPFYLKFLNQVYLIFEYVVWLSVFFSSLCSTFNQFFLMYKVWKYDLAK